MAPRSRVRVFIASSADGFIADAEGSLDWLEAFNSDEQTISKEEEGKEEGKEGNADPTRGYTHFMRSIAVQLMGRKTLDFVEKATRGQPWPLEKPVLVASRRELPERVPIDSVRRVEGPISELIAEAKRVAEINSGDEPKASRDVYLDGGVLIREALDAGLVDEMIVTQMPIILGSGAPLFAGCARRHALELVSVAQLDSGIVQLTYRPKV
jgi:dihydrofolate reductase